jgi:hypothetical protein
LRIWRIDKCSLLLGAIYESLQFEKKERREDFMSGWEYNVGHPK